MQVSLKRKGSGLHDVYYELLNKIRLQVSNINNMERMENRGAEQFTMFVTYCPLSAYS